MRWLVSLVVLLVACDAAEDRDAGRVDSGSQRDVGIDAGTSADAGDSGVSKDAGSTDTGFDAGQLDAAPVDGSLTGTSLEGISLSFDTQLELCDEWREGTTLPDAVAQKTRVVLPPQTRSTLEPGDLAAATIVGGRVEHSPFSADQHPGDAVQSAVTRWDLSGPRDQATLSAEITHQLGPAGTLYESLYVRRAGGDQAPVIYTGELFTEATFLFQPPNGDTVSLQVCGGPEDMETAVVALVAFDGTDWITVIREQKTRLAPAGSAPVYPRRAEMLLSDQPAWSEPILAQGVWSQVYTAEHHNWDEKSRIEVDLDLKWNFQVFQPLRNGEMPTYPNPMVRSVELLGVNTPATTPTANVTLVELPSGAETTTAYDVEIDWTRVDETQLIRELGGCAGARVQSIWAPTASGTYVFQLGLCDGNGPLGGDLALMVPIYFPPNPRIVGQRFDRSSMQPATVDGFDGIEVATGLHTIRFAMPGTFRIVVGNETASAYEIDLFEIGVFGGSRETLTGSNGDVSASFVRQWVAQGAGNSGIYAPVSMTLTFGGQTHLVTAWDRLDYTNTHHNWDDTLVAETDTVRLFWAVQDFGQSWIVRAEQISDGTELLPATVIQ